MIRYCRLTPADAYAAWLSHTPWEEWVDIALTQLKFDMHDAIEVNTNGMCQHIYSQEVV